MNIPIKTTLLYEERRQTIHRHHYRYYSYPLWRYSTPELNYLSLWNSLTFAQ